jgi:hypothetical protein
VLGSYGKVQAAIIPPAGRPGATGRAGLRLQMDTPAAFALDLRAHVTRLPETELARELMAAAALPCTARFKPAPSDSTVVVHTY